MIIAHNLNALNSLNKLKTNNKTKSKAIERLSSGLRINRAADDSAGLSISEKMKAQIRGLSQAQRNIQDGISLIQTAEQGLGDIEDPSLLRLRELSIQAANGTLTGDERQAIQKEVDQLVDGIDSIANDTEFNNIKILRPPLSSTPPVITGGKADIVFIIDKTGSMSSTISNVRANLESFVSNMQAYSVDVRLGLVTYGDVVPSEGGDPIVKKDFTSDLDLFNASIDAISVGGGGDFEESGLEAIEDSANGALSFDFRSDATKQFILVTDASVHDDNDGDGGDGGSTYDIENVANNLVSNGIKLSVVGPVGNSTYTQLKRLSDPTHGRYLNIAGNFNTQLNALATSITEDSGAEVGLEDMQDIVLQVGANDGDTYTMHLLDARAKSLGISNLLVDPREEAIEALGKIDAAIAKISKARSSYGAYNNSLLHTSNNVSSYELNLTDSLSRISDADIAKESMDMIKSNILTQATEAMLAQANQIPQAVLQIIK